MAFRFFGKSLLYALPLGVTFLDCVGYVARVDGESSGVHSLYVSVR